MSAAQCLGVLWGHCHTAGLGQARSGPDFLPIAQHSDWSWGALLNVGWDPQRFGCCLHDTPECCLQRTLLAYCRARWTSLVLGTLGHAVQREGASSENSYGRSRAPLCDSEINSLLHQQRPEDIAGVLPGLLWRS